MRDDDIQRRTDRYLMLLQRYENTLFWRCYRHVRFREDKVLDLLQDIHERLWRSLDTLRPEASDAEEHAWLKTQVASVLSNDRRRRRLHTVSLDVLDDVSDSDDTHAMLMLLDELMARLPADERHLLQELCQGITPEEIARQRQQSLHTVQNLISIARRHLREINEQYNNNDTL